MRTGPAAPARQVFANLGRALAAVGAIVDDVLQGESAERDQRRLYSDGRR
jgi:enamine deaminase RidA (YjgF/YER057c/UK114 family)